MDPSSTGAPVRLGVPLICHPSFPPRHPSVVIRDSANNGIEHGGEERTVVIPESAQDDGVEAVSVFAEQAHNVPMEKVEPRTDNDGEKLTIVIHDSATGKESEVVIPKIHIDGIEHVSVVSEQRPDFPKEKIEPRTDNDGKWMPAWYNDGIEHGNDNVPENYNDGIEHDWVFSEKVNGAPKEGLGPRSLNDGEEVPESGDDDAIEHHGEMVPIDEQPLKEIEPRDFGKGRYISKAENDWNKWQGYDPWFATPREGRVQKIGPK